MPVVLRNHACQDYIDSNGYGKILIAGGASPDGDANRVWDYDIANEIYVERNPLPSNVIHHRLTKHNDRMWIFSSAASADLPIFYIDLNSGDDAWRTMSNSKKYQSRESWVFAYNLKKN